MNLLIEYFTPKNQQRDYEYKRCIDENIKNSLISKIFIFISDESNLDIKSDKVQIVKLDKRPTFNYLFDYCNCNLQNQICIISNTDIFFDNTLDIINKSNIDNTFITLTRWDVIVENNQTFSKFFNHVASQDCWIFKSPIKIDNRCDFLMGKPGCDNRVAQIYLENGFKVKNPSLQIKSYHLHLTGYRTYNNSDIIPGPYLLLQPNDNINVDTLNKTIPHF